jgi:hypothetical protein
MCCVCVYKPNHITRNIYLLVKVTVVTAFVFRQNR